MPTPQQAIDLQSNNDFAGSLDSGLEFIRTSAAWVIPAYALAVAPTALLILSIIADIARHRPSTATFYCWLLLPAMAWRWCVLAVIQQRVCWAITGQNDTRILKRRLFPLIIARLPLAVWVVWGCRLLLVSGIPALMLSALVAPALLDAPTLSWKHSIRPLIGALISSSVWRHFLTLLVTFLMVYIGLVATISLMADMVIPSFAGVSDLRLQLLLHSSALKMGLGLFIWMAFDLLWHVSSVIVFYHLQSRQTGADLQFRLHGLRRTVA